MCGFIGYMFCFCDVMVEEDFIFFFCIQQWIEFVGEVLLGYYVMCQVCCYFNIVGCIGRNMFWIVDNFFCQMIVVQGGDLVFQFLMVGVDCIVFWQEEGYIQCMIVWDNCYFVYWIVFWYQVINNCVVCFMISSRFFLCFCYYYGVMFCIYYDFVFCFFEFNY